MSAGAARSQGSDAITLGAGWLWPASVAALFIGLLYVPGHNPTSAIGDDLVATIAALYVAGLAVAGVRLVRGVILRAGGSHEPIVLLGAGADPLISDAVGPRWRLAALAAGAIMPVLAAVGAARLATLANPASSAHAIAELAVGLNVVIAAGVLVPTPGFPGWALVLALVDLARAPADRRVRRAARVTRSLGVLIVVGGGILSALLGDPMIALLGSVLGFLTWSGSQAAEAQDAAVRFVAAHRAGEVTRPLGASVAPDEPVGEVLSRLRRRTAVVAVEGGAGIVGALGPRQFAPAAASRGRRCRDVMVPLESLRLLGPASPAVEVLPEIARQGFAIVRGPEGLEWVEAAELGRQVRVWSWLRERTAIGRSGDSAGEASR